MFFNDTRSWWSARNAVQMKIIKFVQPPPPSPPPTPSPTPPLPPPSPPPQREPRGQDNQRQASGVIIKFLELGTRQIIMRHRANFPTREVALLQHKKNHARLLVLHL